MKIKSEIYLPNILLTHPFETCNMREISQGLAPEWASSTIFCRVESGSGRPETVYEKENYQHESARWFQFFLCNSPLTYTPPSWLIPLWPAVEHPNSDVWPMAVACPCILSCTDGGMSQYESILKPLLTRFKVEFILIDVYRLVRQTADAFRRLKEKEKIYHKI